MQNSVIIHSEFKRFMHSKQHGHDSLLCWSHIPFLCVKDLNYIAFDRYFIYNKDNRVQGGLIVQSSVTVLTSTDYSHIKK